MAELVVTPEPTPNPKAYKFTTNVELNTGPARTFYDTAEADGDALASELFAIPGVVGVMILNDFCTINQDGSADWSEMIPRIEAILRKALA